MLHAHTSSARAEILPRRSKRLRRRLVGRHRAGGHDARKLRSDSRFECGLRALHISLIRLGHLTAA